MALLAEQPEHEPDPWALEVRSILLEAMGRTAVAEATAQTAIDSYDGEPALAISAFCTWNHDACRYDRAYYWAKRLFEYPAAADELNDQQAKWIWEHHMSGHFAEIEAEVRRICHAGIPAHLAQSLYWCFRSRDPRFALEIATSVFSQTDDQHEQLEWRLRCLRQQALLGDDRDLNALDISSLVDSPDLLSDLGWVYLDLARFADAERVVPLLAQGDPTSPEPRCLLFDCAMRRGETDEAQAQATSLYRESPYDHRGAENLAKLYARLLEVDRALPYAREALYAAPHCHNAHATLALLLVLAGSRDHARSDLQRALALYPEDESRDEPPTESVLVRQVLDGDCAALERSIVRTPASERGAFTAFYMELRRLASLGT
jgi:tetratricopeptide (TPR) repeat protein